MQIQSGKLYENKTWKYLYPCLKDYGNVLKGYLNTVYKLAVGVKDYSLDTEENICIYILIDTNIITPQTSLENYRNNISNFLIWLRNQKYYLIDYIFDHEENKEKHMIVLKLPENYKKAYQKFTKGKYSEMYSSKEIGTFFPYISLENKELEIKINSNIKRTRDILNKNKEYLPEFQKQLNEEFNVKCSLRDLENHELDFPPKMEEEMFNFNKELIY